MLQNYQPFIRSAVGPTAEADPFSQLLKQSRKYQANISAIGEHIDNDGAIVRYVTCCVLSACVVPLWMVRKKIGTEKALGAHCKKSFTLCKIFLHILTFVCTSFFCIIVATRVKSHADLSSVTLLAQDDIGGLQVCS